MGTQVGEVVEHLFRKESGKLASSLARAFGLQKLGVIEDLVQETLLAALDSWAFRGIPENPTAWLHRVAKNKAIDWIRNRNNQAVQISEALPGMLAASETLNIEQNFLDWEIGDSQLRMMFACCHPGIPEESQIALILKTLCGFSVREIANAFLAHPDTIEKRLGRARKYFREHDVELVVPSPEAVHERLETVLRSLYLLFNEGYKRTDSDGLLNRDLCLEALRLALLLADHPEIGSPNAKALVALMTFLAARFDTRLNDRGEIVLLPDQDRSAWNAELIRNGEYYFRISEPDLHTSSYHIEAAIQSLHLQAPNYQATDWIKIFALYKRLYALHPSPIIAMHMSVSMGKVHGPEAAIELLRAHPLPNYYLYHAILGDALERAGQSDSAASEFRQASELVANQKEKALLQERIRALGEIYFP